MSSNPLRPHHVTGKLSPDERTLIIPAMGSFDARPASRELTYYPVPSIYRTIQNPPVWRVLLKFGGTGQRVVAGLDIYGDIVLGRGSGDPDSPDIDLTNLEALDRGVSRRHAMLRPTHHKLYLIDLASTNGTFVNAVPVSKGMAQTLRSNDAIAFGGLNCAVEIVFSPESRPGATVEASPRPEEAPVPPTLELGRPRTGLETVVGGKLPTIPRPSTGPSGDIPPMSSTDLEPKKPDLKK